MSFIETSWLALTPYETALKLQEDAVQKIKKGGKEVILGLEHPDVITLGKRGGIVHPSAGAIPIIKTKRGGLATAHEPGQLVIYPIIHLQRRKITIRNWVFGIEEILISFLSDHNIIGKRSIHAGIWVDHEKIASIGLQVVHGISTHGLAINIHNQLQIFSHIDTCGLKSQSLTSMQKKGTALTIPNAFHSLAEKLKDWIENS